jgi:alkyl sulfatase BDS1-like metallo-beta-lactamase superfamily hydrolase
MGVIVDLAERMWTGETTVEQHLPFTPLMEHEEVTARTAFVSSFANATALDTDEGLVLVDTGSFMLSTQVHTSVRRFTSRALHTAVFTHGHVDHCFGVERYEAEERTLRPRVIAHQAILARFERYKLTAGYNACINARQFQVPVQWPTQFRYPDVIYENELLLEIGGERIELHHARGETDDHTFVWVPGRQLLCTGDLFIWASPNAGNPQKVQRYAREWAAALRRMSLLGAEVLCPGHGLPILGIARVRQALDETAELLESLHDQTLALMNEGATLDDIVHTVKAPARLLERPYLRPIYDEPEFVVRNICRLYGGWWDGDPANLKPPSAASVAHEVAMLAGGSARLMERAEALAKSGDFRLACQLAEWAARANPKDDSIAQSRAKIYERRADAETSLMAKGIFNTAAKKA